MVNLNLTTIIAAAGSLFNIIDFQGNCVDGPGGQTEDLTGIETYTCVPGAQNQKWSFNAVGTNFQITIANFPTTVLSMPMVGTTIPPYGLIYQQAAMRTNSIMTWEVVPNFNFPGKYNIVSTISTNNPPVALTSWAKHPVSSLVADPSAPLTFTGLNQNDVQQAFTLVSQS